MLLPFYKKYWRTAFDIALIVLTVYLIMFAFSHLYKIAAPILFSFVIFLIIEPLAKRLNKWGIKKSIASGISILFFTLLLLGAFSLTGVLITKQSSDLLNRVPEYSAILSEQIAVIFQELKLQLGKLPADFDFFEKSSENAQEMSNKIIKWVTAFLHALVGYFSSFTTFVFNVVVGVVLAYFLSIEIKGWKKIANEKTPRTFKHAFVFLRDNVFKGIASYLKAQFKLISVTFLVILVALLILNVKSAFTVALVAAIFDVLPLLGVSTLFIPWIIYLFVVGQTGLALWLTALLLVVILTRQVLEPKITGDSLGVSAFTMLAFMMISLSMFGIAGVIMSPILVILLKSLYDQGYLHQWITPPIDEFDTIDPDGSIVSTASTTKPEDKDID